MDYALKSYLSVQPAINPNLIQTMLEDASLTKNYTCIKIQYDR